MSARCCTLQIIHVCVFFFFNDTATTEIYTLSLHDALPIYCRRMLYAPELVRDFPSSAWERSEEHTSELQSHHDIVCRLLLEKKKQKTHRDIVYVSPTAAGDGGWATWCR